MKRFISLIAILVLGACASIIHGTSDQISINSLEKGTTIFVDGTPRGKDNATADVERGKVHSLRATKEGCQDVSVETGKKFDKISLLGMLIDLGIITIPLDFVFGGAMQADPKTYTVSPICKG